MFNKFHVVVAETEDDIYRMIRVATNYNLCVTYKIGVYGSERQHELYVFGKPWNYHKFKRALKAITMKVDNKEGRVQ